MSIPLFAAQRSRRIARLSASINRQHLHRRLNCLQQAVEALRLEEGKTNYAPSADLTIPFALSSVVQAVGNLSSFRPRSYVRFKSPQSSPKPNFTSSQSGDHYLTPGDIGAIYDVKAAYSAGYTGAGQSIAVVGQSSIEVSDIENFQNAAGLAVKDPTQILVPDSGTAAVSSGDEAESDIDLEYSGAIGKGATIYFVYVGNNSSYSVFDSIQYAVDTRIAPIITVSYGECETELGSADYASLNSVLEQAASQGQSVVAASGDDGSTGCYGDTDLTTAQQEALAVSFPACSQYVTAMGGTEFPSSDVSSSNTRSEQEDPWIPHSVKMLRGPRDIAMTSQRLPRGLLPTGYVRVRGAGPALGTPNSCAALVTGPGVWIARHAHRAMAVYSRACRYLFLGIFRAALSSGRADRAERHTACRTLSSAGRRDGACAPILDCAHPALVFT